LYVGRVEQLLRHDKRDGRGLYDSGSDGRSAFALACWRGHYGGAAALPTPIPTEHTAACWGGARVLLSEVSLVLSPHAEVVRQLLEGGRYSIDGALLDLPGESLISC
jgi:hypothetical protein